jgi:two-component system, cell cycle response regulator DivK
MPQILLVEDNSANREMLSRRLKRRGFAVIEAVDGQQAVEIAQSAKPDLIIMDKSLPLVDGWEAARRIKDDPALTHIPIVGLTAHAMVGDRELALQAGCNEYATKPVDFGLLVETINRLLIKP